jgi:acyl dehydratase
VITDYLELLTAMIKNYNSFRMNRSLVGFTMNEQIGPLVKSDIMEYARATKDDNPLFETNDLIPPFYLSRLVYPFFKRIMTHPDLNLNLLRMVHARQELTWSRQMRSGEKLSARGSIKSITETPAGEMIEVSGLVMSGEEHIIESISGFIVRAKARHFVKLQIEEDEPEPVFTLEIKTDEGQQLKYAHASGDNNFIHTNNFLAKAAGLPRTIMHGVCLVSMANTALTKAVLNGDITRLCGISCRFANPAFPGETLRLVAYKPDINGELPFNVFNKAGRKVLKNGMFKYKL